MVGPGRLELPTSRLSGVRSNHLSYGPKEGSPKQSQRPVSSVNSSMDRKRNEDGGVLPCMRDRDRRRSDLVLSKIRYGTSAVRDLP